MARPRQKRQKNVLPAPITVFRFPNPLAFQQAMLGHSVTLVQVLGKLKYVSLMITSLMHFKIERKSSRWSATPGVVCDPSVWLLVIWFDTWVPDRPPDLTTWSATWSVKLAGNYVAKVTHFAFKIIFQTLLVTTKHQDSHPLAFSSI